MVAGEARSQPGVISIKPCKLLYAGERVAGHPFAVLTFQNNRHVPTPTKGLEAPELREWRFVLLLAGAGVSRHPSFLAHEKPPVCVRTSGKTVSI